MRSHLFFTLILATGPMVCPLTADRPGLDFSKAFGGSGSDRAVAVAVGPDGGIYVAGVTTSYDFPVNNAFQLQLGGSRLQMTIDGGKTWSASDIRPGVLSIVPCAESPSCLYAGTSAGIYQSFDAGSTWSRVASSPVAVVSALVAELHAPYVIYAASDRGILKSADGGISWTTANRGLEAESDDHNGGYVDGVLVAHPALASRLFADFGNLLYRSTDGAESWSSLPAAPIGVRSLAFDPANPDTLFATSGADYGVYRSTDSGETWQKLVTPATPPTAGAIAVTPGSIYVATANGIYRSADSGNTWSPTGLVTQADWITADKTNPQILYANADRVYETRDGGTSWSPILSPPRSTVSVIALVGQRFPTLFIGSDLPQNGFVTKMTADGATTEYSTYLGGSYLDYPTGIAVDADGNAYVSGYTYSSDFPTTAGAVQRSLRGRYNAFIAKISPDGSRLVYSTLLGGSNGDSANAIAVDSGGYAYVTGFTGSTDFPITSGAAQVDLKQGCTRPALSKQGDAFVSKINPGGTALAYSTYLGGTCADQGLGLTVDSTGAAYVTGVTSSSDFPTTKGAIKTAYPGSANTGFLAKLTPNGDSLDCSTFIGGPGNDVASAVALDDEGYVYVTGSSFGLNTWKASPTCRMAYGNDGSPFGVLSGGDAYVWKFDPLATSVLFEQYIGDCVSGGVAIAVDKHKNVWIAGENRRAPGPLDQVGGIAPPFPAPFPTLHPFQAAGLGWGFISEFSADGAMLLFSSLVDTAWGMALDRSGNVFVVGDTGWFGAVGFPKQSIYGRPGLPNFSSLVVRIDSAVNGDLTLEAPQKMTISPPTPGHYSTVAPGGFIVLTGAGLGPTQELGPALSPDGNIAASLAGTMVTFDDLPAPLLSVQDQKITCIVPFELANRTSHVPDVNTNTTVIKVQRDGSQSNSIRVPVLPVAAEILAIVNEDGASNSKDSPARTQSTVAIYVAGLGQTDPPSVDGAIETATSGRPRLPISVSVSRSVVEPVYLGPAPGMPSGVTQINIAVPDVPPGEYPLLTGSGPLGSNSYDSATLYVK